MAEAGKECIDLVVKERTQTKVCTAQRSPLGRCEVGDVGGGGREGKEKPERRRGNAIT